MVGQPNLESSDYNRDQRRNRLKIMLLYPWMIMKADYGEVSQRVLLGSELACQKPRRDANLAFPSVATPHASPGQLPQSVPRATTDDIRVPSHKDHRARTETP
jgi:hypothetical protein